MVKVNLKRAEGCEDLPLPQYKTSGSVGMDLYSGDTLILNSGESRLVSAGIHIALPEGYEAQIRPRSGNALKHGISIVNTPGTIDADYRGLIGVILINHGKEPFNIKKGDRIAQMIINKIEQAEFEVMDELNETDRGHGGFGSTGKR